MEIEKKNGISTKLAQFTQSNNLNEKVNSNFPQFNIIICFDLVIAYHLLNLINYI